MGLFSKLKKKSEPELTPPKILTPCERGEHLYRDFPPIIVHSCHNGEYYIAVRETYVCVMCGNRKEVTLEKTSWNHCPSEEDFNNTKKEMEEKYKGWVQPIARVRDMIEDAVNVDRERLRIWEKLHTPDKQVDKIL